MNTEYIPTPIHTTARPTIAVAVVGFVVIGIISLFSIQWARTSSASDTSNVGTGAVLADNVVAVVSLYDSASDDPFVSRVKAHFLLEQGTRTIALMDTGDIVAVADGEVSRYITGRTRPVGWFLPGTLGVLVQRSSIGSSSSSSRGTSSSSGASVSSSVGSSSGGNSGVGTSSGSSPGASSSSSTSSSSRPSAITSSRITGNALQIRAIDRSDTATIDSLIPESAVYGAHIECESDCPELSIGDIKMNFPESLGNADFFSLVVDGGLESLITTRDGGDGVSSDHMEAFAREILARSYPVTVERELENGIVVKELLPGTDVATSRNGELVQFGDGDNSLYLLSAIVEDTAVETYLSTTESVFDDNKRLSTQSWTSKVCNVIPSYFFAISFSSTLAENANAPLYLVRDKHGWRICER